VYALAILGVEMINQNGLPTLHNPDEATGRFAIDARHELGKSTDAAVIGVAGRIVGQYGLMFTGMFRGSGHFAVDYAPIAESLLVKAQELEPGNGNGLATGAVPQAARGSGRRQVATRDEPTSL
jgi:hypothetical protein